MKELVRLEQLCRQIFQVFGIRVGLERRGQLLQDAGVRGRLVGEVDPNLPEEGFHLASGNRQLDVKDPRLTNLTARGQGSRKEAGSGHLG